MVAGAYLPASQNTGIIDITLGTSLVPEAVGVCRLRVHRGGSLGSFREL
jgi:hypothetical protein